MRPPPLGFAFLLLATRASADAPLQGGYGDYLDWESWANVSVGERGGLASSHDPGGGPTDANRYEFPPGLQLGNTDTIAATLTGPGVIWRFWMPHFAASQGFALRMFFDGEAMPRIDTTSDQVLNGTFTYFGDPIVTTVAGGQVSYEPIPFRESVRIETENRINLWHWYQHTVRLYPPGTDITSYTGTLDAEQTAARSAVVAMFQNAGEHPAGGSGTAVRTVIGAASVPAGGSLSVASLSGPGLVRKINLRMSGATDAELDSLHLRVSYDGEPTPAIDAPVGWFFGAGHQRAPWGSLLIGNDSPDGFYCYWPMPFRIGMDVELANVSAVPVAIDSAVVEHEAKPIASNAGYLHAAMAETDAMAGVPAHVMMSATGTGHYVGSLLYIEQDHDMLFFLEGDDLYVIDGAEIGGTGVEDAYNGGFYYNWFNFMQEPEGNSPQSAIRPLSGILYVAQTSKPELGRADQYRWLIADRVPFSQSLEVKIQTEDVVWAPSKWRSVAFWYQLPASATVAPVPPDRFGLELELGPNPIRESTRVRFSLPAAGRATIELLDVRGRRVDLLADGPFDPGPHELRWERGSLASGVYFLRLETRGVHTTRKLVLGP